MPAAYQGTPFLPGDQPISNLSLPRGVSNQRQQKKLNFLQSTNRRHLATRSQQSELDARIRSYELAFRMQATAPSEDESWVANSQDLQVNTRMWLTDRNLEHRHEKFNIEFEVYTPARFFRIRDELIFRTYTAPQFDELILEAPLWDVVGIHDFAYQIDSPVQVTDRSEDIVYVLQRK